MTTFTLSQEAAARFERYTRANLGKRANRCRKNLELGLDALLEFGDVPSADPPVLQRMCEILQNPC